MSLHLLKQVELLDAHPQIAGNSGKYPTALNNLVISQILLRQYTEARQTIGKLRSIKFHSEEQDNYFFSIANNLELFLYTATGDFKNGILFLKSIHKEIKKRKIKDMYKDSQALSNFITSVLYFGAGDYHSSAKELHKLLNFFPDNVRNDLHCFAKIFSLVVHYELGNTDLLEHLTRSVYRYLYKRNKIFKFEFIVLNFIRNKLPGITSKSQLIDAFVELKKEIKKISGNLIERKAFDYFDFISWLESKIENRSFEEIVREKANKKISS